jgi:protein phosphatase
MGVMLPKPVMSAVNEVYGNPIFRVGSSCVNGFRETMEDAHLIFLKPDWGFFGVFDGHVNGDCSQYAADEFEKYLKDPALTIPISDERLKEIALTIDKKFIDAKRTGGSTGTFCIAQKIGDNIHLQIGNVGDSRVLVCKDGECIAMTTDHKPTLVGERRRIEMCGGFVDNGRVNGSLAVSRAFGDIDYKGNASGDQLSQPVIALADVTHCDLRFGSKDFALLACDGVFEGNFSNEEVIEFAAQQLNLLNDPTAVSQRVCEEAIARGSKDNISCLIVLFESRPGYEGEAVPKRFIPGPFSAPSNQAFRRAYFAMAKLMNFSPEQALEMRYDAVVAAGDDFADAEQVFFKEGPPAELTGSERTQWFAALLNAPQETGTARRESLENLQRMQQLQSMGIPMNVILELMAEVNSSNRRP